MNKNSSKLYIPVNVRRRNEFVDGFGAPELRITILWGIIGVLLGLFFFFKFDSLFIAVLITFLIPAATFVFVRKDATFRSTVDYLKDDYKYFISQKNYDYKYYNFLKR
jgi:hypothetical protein